MQLHIIARFIIVGFMANIKIIRASLMTLSLALLGACSTFVDNETTSFHADESCQDFQNFVRKYNRELSSYNQSAGTAKDTSQPNDILDLFFRSEKEKKANALRKVHKEKCR